MTAAALAVAGIAWAATVPEGVIGPKTKIQPTGRKLDPVGKRTRLGNFPTGGALTTNGRFLWTLSTGRAQNDIRIVRVKPRKRCAKNLPRRRARRCRRARRRQIGRVVQKIPMPGLSGGVAMAPGGRTSYVSGIADSSHEDQEVGDDVPGQKGDVIHVFTLNRRSGKAQRAGVIGVPPPSDAPAVQTFPPGTARLSWPRDLAVSHDGRTLLAALNLADYAAVIDTASRRVRYVKVGRYPYGAGISRDGRFGLVGSETEGTVAAINLDEARKVKDIQVGPRLSHPEGIAIDPKRDRAYVAIANQDVIAVIDTVQLRVERTLSVARPQGTGTTPTYLSVTRDGCDLLSANSGEDAIAVFSLSRKRRCDRGLKRKRRQGRVLERRRKAKALELVGRIPVGSYPTAVAATPNRGKLVWVSARGLGVGPNPNGPNPRSPNDSDDHINSFQYLPSIVRGSSGILNFPSDKRIRKLTPRAARQIVPTNSTDPPADTPIRAGGPIKHVFYIVKENRTYDQVLGDESRGDGDPALTLFGPQVTPNLRALAQRFPLLDHVYANSEASIDGHFWTAAGAVSDYVTKNWPQNYGGRGRPYDFGAYQVTAPPKGYIFERAINEGVSFFNYGEALAGLSPLPDRDQTQEDVQKAAQVLASSDIALNAGCYDSDLGTSTVVGTSIDVYDSSLPPGAEPGSRSRFDCFNARFQLQVAAGTVPDFSYIILANNHTQGVQPGSRTPDAQVAANDWGMGQVVDAISHSPIWDSSLILVIEDDSQDGADHVDAHRIPALVISPYAKRGAVIHNRYDQLSFLRTLEIIVGLKPLHLAEALAVPLYDALGPSPDNSEPYDAIVPGVDMAANNPNTARNRRASEGLPLVAPDQIPQRTLDGILWRYRHGFDAAPPPPGPNSSGIDEAREEDAEEEELFADPAELVRRLRAQIHRAQRALQRGR
ncbi:MAG: alkaline phosphatase family protein [Actinomycetota bacterium]